MGIIFDIQKCCYHDGPGIRTTIFLKGCNLRCLWCHNPESFSISPQLKYIKEKCSYCGSCANTCTNNIHIVTKENHSVNFNSCTLCGQCIKSCKNSALSFIGQEMSVQEVVDIVLQDKDYYEISGGGVTISGGEATLSGEFLFELLTLLKKHDLHTCLETNGYILITYLMKILPLIDLFLLDYKITNEELLYKYTGAKGNNWGATLNYLQDMKKPVILRAPIIPSINDNIEHIEGIKSLKRKYPVIQSVEIMPYHSLGSIKWEQIGLTYSLSHIKEPSKQDINEWESRLKTVTNFID